MRTCGALLASLPIIILAAVASPGCGSEERPLDERLFGVWTAHDRGRSYQLTFNADGSFATDMVRAVNASQGEYWVRGGTTLVLEGTDDAGQTSRLEGVLFLTPTTVVPRAMEPVGAHVGLIGYWSTQDGTLSYEFRGDALVIRRELLGGRSQSLISKGSWKQSGTDSPVEVSFTDEALSGTLELFEDRVLGQAFHR